MRRGDRNRIEGAKSEPALALILDLTRATREDLERDPMMREGKDRYVDWALPCRSCFEWRQNPHTAPTLGGLLKQNPIFLTDKSVVFDEFFCLGSTSLGRKRCRVGGAAKFFQRADWALWLTRRTDERAEIHERGIMPCGSLRWEKIGSITPNRLAASR